MPSASGLWRNFHKTAAALAASLGLSLACPAQAQVVTGGSPVGVMDRPRPQYDAVGLSLGDWTLFPALAATANYDDNVFRSLTDTRSDWYFETTPSFRLQRKTPGGDVFDLFGDTDTFNYVEFPRLNMTDWTLGADGKVNLSKQIAAVFSGYYGEYHEDFASVNETAVNAEREHTRYFRGHLDGAASYGSGDWLFTGGGSLDRYDWQPTALLNGGSFSNADRDATYGDPYAKVTYQAAPSYQLYVHALYDSRDFDRSRDRFGFDRTSSGTALDGGITALFGKSVSLDAYLGYRWQNFRNAGEDPAHILHDVSELDYGLTLDWYAAPALTAHLSAIRGLSDLILPHASLSDDQTVKLSADWEVRPDILVQAFGAYTNSRLLGTTRVDRYPSSGATLRYLINRYASAEVAYLFTARKSTDPTVEFADHIVTVGLNFHI